MNYPTYNESDNLALFQRVAEGDRKAFEALYERYAGAILRVIVAMVRNQELAEEVLQDTFVKIWRSAKTYDPKQGRLFTWMARIAKNTAIDHTKTKRYQQHRGTESLNAKEYVDQWIASDQPIADSGLRKTLTQLTERQQEIIEYLYFRSFSQREASKALNIPLGTLKTEVRKAMMQLRQVLKGERNNL